jgi:hypothetical protein
MPKDYSEKARNILRVPKDKIPEWASLKFRIEKALEDAYHQGILDGMDRAREIANKVWLGGV